MDEYRTALLKVVSMLAQPSTRQEAYLLRLGTEVDELALELDDLVRLAGTKRQAGELSEREYEVLRALDDALQGISGPKNSHLWTLEALAKSSEWQAIRRLAGSMLREMGAQQNEALP